MPLNNSSLDSREKRDIFLLALGYHENRNISAANASFMSNYPTLATNLHGPMAAGYQKAAKHLANLPRDTLTKEQLKQELQVVFPSGGYASDMRDNISEIYDKIIAAIDSGMLGFTKNSADEPSAPRPDSAALRGGSQRIIDITPQVSKNTGLAKE